MSTKEKSLPVPSKAEDNTKALLQVLGMALDGFSTDVKTSSALLEQGAKTDLVLQIQKGMDNPLKSMVEGANMWEKHIRPMIDTLIIKHFQANKSLIEAAYRQLQNDNYYYIVLKEDIEENRDVFFSIIEEIEMVATKFPVYIQFVPHSLMDKLQHLPAINLEQNATEVHSAGKA